MIATLPLFKARKPLELIQITLIVLIVLSPIALKIHFDQQARSEAAMEYSSTRHLVLAEIGSAIERRDLSTLQRIQAKFASAVKDREFLSALSAGLAEVTAREAEVELTVSKHLDMARHREESSVGLEPTPVSLPDDKTELAEKLSKLPQ